MNIFVLDRDAVQSARMMCDKHVVKMILESCQLLSTAHHVLDGNEIVVQSDKRKYKTFLNPSKKNICKATMINHPCTIWTRTVSSNYIWLWRHGYALCNEYKIRYNKIHAMESMLMDELYDVPKNITSGKITDFPQAMPDSYKHEDVVMAYRQYYLGEKVRFAKWKTGVVPVWFEKKDPAVGLMEEIPF